MVPFRDTIHWLNRECRKLFVTEVKSLSSRAVPSILISLPRLWELGILDHSGQQMRWGYRLRQLFRVQIPYRFARKNIKFRTDKHGNITDAYGQRMKVLLENIALLFTGWAFLFFVVVFRLVRAVAVYLFRLRPRPLSTFPIDSDSFFQTMSLGVTSECVLRQIRQNLTSCTHWFATQSFGSAPKKQV